MMLAVPLLGMLLFDISPPVNPALVAPLISPTSSPDHPLVLEQGSSAVVSFYVASTKHVEVFATVTCLSYHISRADHDRWKGFKVTIGRRATTRCRPGPAVVEYQTALDQNWGHEYLDIR